MGKKARKHRQQRPKKGLSSLEQLFDREAQMVAKPAKGRASIFKELVGTEYSEDIQICFEYSGRLLNEEQYGIDDWCDWRCARQDQLREFGLRCKEAEEIVDEEVKEMIWGNREKIYQPQKSLCNQSSYDRRIRYNFSNFLEIMSALGIVFENNSCRDPNEVQVEHIYREGNKVIFGVTLMSSWYEPEIKDYKISNDEKEHLLKIIAQF